MSTRRKQTPSKVINFDNIASVSEMPVVFGPEAKASKYAEYKNAQKPNRLRQIAKSTRKTVLHAATRLLGRDTNAIERKCYRYFVNWVTIENLVFTKIGTQFVMDNPPDAPDDPCEDYEPTRCPGSIKNITCKAYKKNNKEKCVDSTRISTLKNNSVIKDRYATKPYTILEINGKYADAEPNYILIYRNKCLYVIIKSGIIKSDVYEDTHMWTLIPNIIISINYHLQNSSGTWRTHPIHNIVLSGHSYGCVCALLILRNQLISKPESKINIDSSKIYVVGSAPFPWLKPEDAAFFSPDVLRRIRVYGIIWDFGKSAQDFNGVDRFVYGITSENDYSKYKNYTENPSAQNMAAIQMHQLPMRFLHSHASTYEKYDVTNEIERRVSANTEINYKKYSIPSLSKTIPGITNPDLIHNEITEIENVDFIDPEFMEEYGIVSTADATEVMLPINNLIAETTHGWSAYRDVFRRFISENKSIKPQYSPSA